MAKRFTDSEKWERPWFRALPVKMKLLWVYICDKCDIAGIWYVDLDLASFLIGEKITKEEAESFLSKQITVLNNGSKWFIGDFVKFQYGELVPNNNLHKSVLSKLNSLGAGQGLSSPSAGAKDKVKDKDKVDIKNNNLLFFLETWNSKMPFKVKDLSSKRKDHLSARIQEPVFVAEFGGILDKILASDFLMGRIARDEKHKNWKVTFDWLIKNDENYLKVLEGNYANKKSRGDL